MSHRTENTPSVDVSLEVFDFLGTTEPVEERRMAYVPGLVVRALRGKLAAFRSESIASVGSEFVMDGHFRTQAREFPVNLLAAGTVTGTKDDPEEVRAWRMIRTDWGDLPVDDQSLANYVFFRRGSQEREVSDQLAGMMKLLAEMSGPREVTSEDLVGYENELFVSPRLPLEYPIAVPVPVESPDKQRPAMYLEPLHHTLVQSLSVDTDEAGVQRVALSVVDSRGVGRMLEPVTMDKLEFQTEPWKSPREVLLKMALDIREPRTKEKALELANLVTRFNGLTDASMYVMGLKCEFGTVGELRGGMIGSSHQAKAEEWRAKLKPERLLVGTSPWRLYLVDEVARVALAAEDTVVHRRNGSVEQTSWHLPRLR